MSIILNSDSYKTSHFLQYPPGTKGISAYIEARPGGDYDRVLFFGLQMFLKAYLTMPIAKADIDEAECLIVPHGLLFNRAGWETIVDEFGGLLPIEIEALPEGTVAPVGVPLVQITNTDPRFFWLPNYIETALLRAVWYPSTVATLSYSVRQKIAAALEKSCDDPAAVLPSRLHDFGARGATSKEQAGIGGLAHLVSFDGTDTLEALVYARRYYGEPMAGFSIPAAEHSTITSWGEDHEAEAYRMMVEQFAGEGKAVSVVSDSYDLWNAVDEIWGRELKDFVKTSGGTVVIRPDSGDPTRVPIETIERLAARFGSAVNGKGYRVLDPSIRVIQGDGMSPKTIAIVLDRLLKRGWSAENIAFGMGGGLLQKVNRDTLRFAMKANARMDARGIWHDVSKAPKTDPSKASKAGRQVVIRGDDREPTALKKEALSDRENLLVPVFSEGRILRDRSLTEIRQRISEEDVGDAL